MLEYLEENIMKDSANNKIRDYSSKQICYADSNISILRHVNFYPILERGLWMNIQNQILAIDVINNETSKQRYSKKSSQ